MNDKPPNPQSDQPPTRPAGFPGHPPGAEELLDLLARQNELYRRLRRLAGAQRGLIAAEDPSGLVNLLMQRQQLIDQLAEVNLRLEPVRADWKRIEATLSDPQRRKAGTLVEQVGQLLAEILAADEADAKLLLARKEMVGQQVETMTTTSQAQAAYRRSAGPVRPTAPNVPLDAG